MPIASKSSKTRTSSHVRRTGSTAAARAKTDVLSATAWERVLDQLRLRLNEKPSRSAVFGRAGLRHTKMLWMRRSPDLRASVIIQLARALKTTPGNFLDLMVKESQTDALGRVQF